MLYLKAGCHLSKYVIKKTMSQYVVITHAQNHVGGEDDRQRQDTT